MQVYGINYKCHTQNNHIMLLYTSLDGQKIAKRLASSISKETATAKRLLQDYNTASSAVTDSFTPLSIQDILAPDSEFWQSSISSYCRELSWNMQKDIMNAYIIMKRTEEELSLLHQEMQNVLLYCVHRKECVVHEIESISKKDDQYHRGLVSLLQNLLWRDEVYHTRATAAFAKLDLDNSSIDTVFSDSDSDLESDDSGDDECCM